MSKLNLSNFNKEERIINIESLFAKYPDIFYLEGDKLLSTTDIYQHLNKVRPDIQPFFSKPYRFSHALKNEINNQIDQMFKENIIEPCQSE